MPIRNLIFVFGCLSLCGMGCYPSESDIFIPIPTSICLRTMHHDVPQGDVFVYLKYGCDTFPGFDKAEDWYDTVLVSDVQGRVCVAPVPPGHHWAVALGASEHGNTPLPIYGRMPIWIDIDQKPKVDTAMYLFE